MKSNILQVLAFFYLTITTAHATFLPLIMGGIVSGKVVVKGLFLSSSGIAIATKIHKHLDDVWKQRVGPDTQMPSSIQNCMQGSVGQEAGIDGKSLIRFESFVNPKGTADINIIANGNANAGANINININDQTTTTPTQGLGPPRSSATDMAKSYGAPVGNSQSTTTNTASSHVQEAITSVEKSVHSLFFTDKDLSLGKKMKIEFEKSSNKAPFLPQEMVDKVQFTSNNFDNIIEAFNLSSTSQQALIMKQVLTYCGDDRLGDKCCNSLETMLDFAESVVGKSAKALSTMVDKDRKLEYSVEGFKNIPAGNKLVLCHKVPFPCAFFYCQQLEKTMVFLATLVAVDGSTTNAPAICHQDTKTWDPTHWAFQQLNAKPGSCPICHFLLDDDVLWVGNKA